MSDLDWDDEEFEPSAVVQEKAQWDDEEEEEEEVPGGATDEETNEKSRGKSSVRGRNLGGPDRGKVKAAKARRRG